MSIRRLTIVFAAVMAVVLVCPSGAQSQFVLDLNGIFAQELKDAQGGAISADVIEFREGVDSCFSTKHIGQPKYEDFDVFSSIPPSNAFADWINSSLTCDPTRRDGKVAETSPFRGGLVWSKDFFHALISEVDLPACDAATRNTVLGFLEVKFSPELITRSNSSGPASTNVKQKLWFVSNFRLLITGLDTTKVTRVEPISIKRDIIDFHGGPSAAVDLSTAQKLPGLLHFPNIEVTLATSRANSWTDWHESFVVNGNSGPSNEKEGVLILYAPDFKTELARVLLHRLGIIQVEPVPSDQNLSLTPQVKAIMYCDSIEFMF